MEPTTDLYNLLVSAGSVIEPTIELSAGEDHRHMLRQVCHFYANLILTLEVLAGA